MRTTLAIDDDVLEQVKEYAEDRKLSMGKAASDLIRRGISRPMTLQYVDGLYLPILPPDSPVVTTKRVLEMEDEW
ncbi:MAG TPA: CopG family transcriptional regulator [Acidobacteriaceae bacterium]|jgi:hypothetical protein|nr:CopG family transcriptional regulator [Acidobacteriaceae bacterium]